MNFKEFLLYASALLIGSFYSRSRYGKRCDCSRRPLIMRHASLPDIQLSPSVRLSNDSPRMATLATEYTRNLPEFRLFGVEQTAIDRLRQRNREAAVVSVKTACWGNLIPVVYQALALGFIILGLALLLDHSGKNLGGIVVIIVLTLRTLQCGSVILNPEPTDTILSRVFGWSPNGDSALSGKCIRVENFTRIEWKSSSRNF